MPTNRARFVAGYLELLCGDLDLSRRDRLRLAKVADLAVRDYYQRDTEELYRGVLRQVFDAVTLHRGRLRRVFTVNVASDDLACYIDDGLREAGVPELIARAATLEGRGVG